VELHPTGPMLRKASTEYRGRRALTFALNGALQALCGPGHYAVGEQGAPDVAISASVRPCSTECMPSTRGAAGGSSDST
jgi:hypothetical protein